MRILIRISFITAILLINSSLSYAQIEKEILNYVDTTDLLANNGRKMLGKALIDNDSDKAEEIFLFLDTMQLHNNKRVFGKFERIRIDLLLHRWEDLDNELQNFGDVYNEAWYPDATPLRDILYEECIIHADELKIAVHIDNNDPEFVDFIEIFIVFLSDTEKSYDFMNMLTEYNKKYPDTPYQQFINHLSGRSIDSSYSEPKRTYWGLAIGSGYMGNTGGLSNYFDGCAVFSANMDFCFGNVWGAMNANVGSGKLKRQIEGFVNDKNTIFEKGESFNISNVGFRGGYMVVTTPHFNLSPFGDFGLYSIQSRMYDSDSKMDEYKPVSSFKYGGGIQCQLKLFNWNIHEGYYTMGTFIALQLSAAYNLHTSQDKPEYKGDIYVLEARLVWGIGNF